MEWSVLFFLLFPSCYSRGWDSSDFRVSHRRTNINIRRLVRQGSYMGVCRLRHKLHWLRPLRTWAQGLGLGNVLPPLVACIWNQGTNQSMIRQSRVIQRTIIRLVTVFVRVVWGGVFSLFGFFPTQKQPPSQYC